jgi:hypothetical protein
MAPPGSKFRYACSETGMEPSKRKRLLEIKKAFLITRPQNHYPTDYCCQVF